MDISTQINIFLVLCNIFVVVIGAFVAFTAIKHFKMRNLYDQWIIALSDDYHKHFVNVIALIESEISGEAIIEKIKNDNSLRKSVNYVLDYWSIKATSIRFNVVDRKLAIRMAYHQILYYFDNLRPWIQYRQESTNHELIYHDFEWLYNYCKENKGKIEKWKSK